MGVIPFRENYTVVNDRTKKRSGTYRGPMCALATNPRASCLEAKKNPEEADNKGLPMVGRKGPFLLGAHTDSEGRARRIHSESGEGRPSQAD